MPRSTSRVATARATVDLPEPDRPVRSRTTPSGRSAACGGAGAASAERGRDEPGVEPEGGEEGRPPVGVVGRERDDVDGRAARGGRRDGRADRVGVRRRAVEGGGGEDEHAGAGGKGGRHVGGRLDEEDLLGGEVDGAAEQQVLEGPRGGLGQPRRATGDQAATEVLHLVEARHRHALGVDDDERAGGDRGRHDIGGHAQRPRRRVGSVEPAAQDVEVVEVVPGRRVDAAARCSPDPVCRAPACPRCGAARSSDAAPSVGFPTTPRHGR